MSDIVITIDQLKQSEVGFRQLLEEKKRESGRDPSFWYPYDSMSNLVHLDRLLQGDFRNLSELIGNRAVLDIGAADGEMAFFLESLGLSTAIVDHAPTNHNGLEGARALKKVLGSATEIHDIDLDSQFSLPEGVYGLTFFLGILYHLKNPYYVLEQLARRTRWCLISTRVAKFTPDHRVDFSDYPLAYLVHPSECNNDPTNFWMFSHAGLRRVLERTGWTVRQYMAAGDTVSSDPASAEHDERAFALLESSVVCASQQ